MNSLSFLGEGEFGSVFTAQNRLDGLYYAVKHSNNPLHGKREEMCAVREVMAHAALSHHKHIVKYFSAWCEKNRLIIQNEYCNGKSVKEYLIHLKSLPVQKAENSTKPVKKSEAQKTADYNEKLDSKRREIEELKRELAETKKSHKAEIQELKSQKNQESQNNKKLNQKLITVSNENKGTRKLLEASEKQCKLLQTKYSRLI